MQQIFSDTTSHTDLLGRRPFAKGIARSLFYAIPEQNASFVFGLNGRWGSGKSTLLKFVVEEIQLLHQDNKNDRFEIFEFNPWMFSRQEQLLWSFYRTLLRKIKQNDSIIKEKTKNIISWLEDSTFGKMLESIGGEHSDKIKKSLQHLLGEGVLEDIKEKLDRALVDENIRLYIIMDDLDRLTPDEITQVFQLVKLNANFKNTIFLLAYDKEIVVNAVEQKFKDNGERYLAKIVQVDYTLPEMLEEEVEAIFFKELKNLLRRLGIIYLNFNLRPFWSKHGLRNYFHTLRDVYRFVNGLTFRLPDIYKEVNITYFLVLEAIRIFDYEGYQILYRECNESMRLTQKFPFFRENEWESKIKNPTTLELIRVLRQPPKIESGDIIFEKERNLFSFDFFERYFTLRLSQKDLPTIDFLRFMNDPENGVNCLEGISESGRMDSLLLRLMSPDLELEFDKIDVKAVHALITFFDEHQKLNYDYWSAMYQISHIFINVLIINRNQPENIEKLWKEVLIETSYPHYSRFILLNAIWEGLISGKWARFEQHESLTDGFKSRKDQIRKVLNNYLIKNKKSLPINELEGGESDYVTTYLMLFAKMEPVLYLDFMNSRFIKIEQMSWLLQKTIYQTSIKINCSWDMETAPHLLPRPVQDHFHLRLNEFMQHVNDKTKSALPEWQLKKIHFFLAVYPVETFSNSAS